VLATPSAPADAVGTRAQGKKGHAPAAGKPGHAPALTPGGAPTAASRAPKEPVGGPPCHANEDEALVAGSWGAGPDPPPPGTGAPLRGGSAAVRSSICAGRRQRRSRETIGSGWMGIDLGSVVGIV
jgi:hypothetical protein